MWKNIKKELKDMKLTELMGVAAGLIGCGIVGIILFILFLVYIGKYLIQLFN